MTPQRTLPELAPLINAEHSACLEAARDAIGHAVEVGRLLSEAKSQARHGEWAGWVAENCDFGIRQAQNYMRVYHNRDRIEAEMRSGDSHLDSLRGAVATLAEPRDRLAQLEGTIAAGFAEFKSFGTLDVVNVMLAEVLDVVSSRDWPPGENVEEKIRHCLRVSVLASRCEISAAEHKVRFERAMGELLAEIKQPPGSD